MITKDTLNHYVCLNHQLYGKCIQSWLDKSNCGVSPMTSLHKAAFTVMIFRFPGLSEVENSESVFWAELNRWARCSKAPENL